GGISKSSRSRPELPPSSATVTTAVKSNGNFFNPRSKVESPVPPPMMTTRFRRNVRSMYSALSCFDVAMRNNRFIVFSQQFSVIFSKRYRTMLAACTAKCNNKLCFAFIFVLRNHEGEQVRQFFNQRFGFVPFQDIARNRFIQAGLRFQFFNIVRV